jgi:tetratricopeptide (TPR) repeat protein
MFLNGRVNGHRKMYYQNGKIVAERDYKDGIENGFEIEYYEDGSLKQKGEFTNGKENGIWEMYFPNVQLKQRCIFDNGVMDGETTVYYSTGKVLAVEVTKNGKTAHDKRLEKINQVMKKGHNSNKEDDYKSAIKNYSKAIELDSTYAEAYFSRGTVNLNYFQFDEAIADFDKALQFEPFMPFALANRAFARIRKYQFGSSRTLSSNSEVTVLASKDKVPMPDGEQEKICNDLQKAVFLGDRSKMIMEELSTHCQTKIGR